jgi:hypothetical protein
MNKARNTEKASNPRELLYPVAEAGTILLSSEIMKVEIL